MIPISAKKVSAVLAALLAGSLTHATEVGYFGVRPGVLELTRARLDAHDKLLEPARKKLLEEAEAAMRVEPPSVTQNPQKPPGGDEHDYHSTATYFWPDPKSSNGLPYIRRDGHANPETRGPASDRPRVELMARTVETLALAYWCSGREDYAARAVRCLHVWFLDPATRMNPNLNYAQGIPGVNTGRGTGIIEGRAIAEAADSAQLLAGSPSWSQKDNAALKDWLSKYLSWLLASKNGREEAAAKNNHGTLYDVQAMRLALVLGKKEVAKKIAEAAMEKRVAIQIAPDGSQPLELERTASLSYSRFNLDAFFELAMLAEYVGVDLWHYQTAEGAGLRKALDFLIPFVEDPAKKWPHEQVKDFDRAEFVTILRQAAIVYGEPKYEKIMEKFPGTANKRLQLLCPLPGTTPDGHPH